MSAIKDGHIGYREATATLIVILITKTFLSCPRLPIIEGKTAGWMIPLLGMLLALVGMVPLLYLMKSQPEKNLVEIAEDHGGMVCGLVVSLLVSGYFLFNIVLIVRQFTETVIVALLPATPISVVTVCFLAGLMYAAYQGIESITRAAWLLLPFIILGIVGVLLLTFPKAQLDNVFPFWGAGIKPIATLSFIKTSLYSEVLIMGMLNPYIRDREKVPGIMIKALLLSGILFSLTVLIYVMVFGLNTSIFSGNYPLYNLARLIYFGRFVQRVESIFIFIWVFSMLVNVATLFYGLCLTLATGLRLPMFRPLIFPLAVLTYAINFMISNFPQAVWLDGFILHKYSFGLTLSIPTLLLLLVKLRPLKGGGPRVQKVH